MDRPGMILYNQEMFEFKQYVEEQTGFVCYEVNPGDQSVWYGLSNDFDGFKELLDDKFPTGTIAYLMDTGKRHMYHRQSNTWFEIS